MTKDFIAWGGYLIALIVGTLLYFFPARRKELDDATARLILTLQQTVKALEDDLNLYKERTLKLEGNQAENTVKIAALETERKLLKDFIAGRDEATMKFQNDCMKMTGETNKLVGEMFVSLERNNAMTQEFVSTMKVHLLNVEKVAIT